MQMQSSRETDDNYKDVVAILNQKLRVIKGACKLQWIAQNKVSPTTWKSFAYCATKEGLLLRLPKAGYGCNPEAWKLIDELKQSFAETYYSNAEQLKKGN